MVLFTGCRPSLGTPKGDPNLENYHELPMWALLRGSSSAPTSTSPAGENSGAM